MRQFSRLGMKKTLIVNEAWAVRLLRIIYTGKVVPPEVDIRSKVISAVNWLSFR